MASSMQLPQDVWWLICQELSARQDFNCLLNYALVNKTMASHALPLLYSIQETSRASMGDASVDDKAKLAHLWRTIILSSIGDTAYPYCLWLKTLKLGDLHQLINDMAQNVYGSLRPSFFSGPMQRFEILSRTSKTRRGVPVLELQTIVEKVGDKITEFVRDAADQQNKSVSLTNLEGQFIPTTYLTLWASRLSTLTSLRLQDGSVLTAEVGEAIRDNCRYFKELTCYNIKGSAVDENLAAFFLTLPQNTLETFTVLSWNDLGQQTFAALAHHALSLTKLELFLGSAAFAKLDALEPCKTLVELQLEANTSEQPSTWATDAKDVFQAVGSWLKECESLVHLRMVDVPSATTLLADVLKPPKLHLTSLDLKLRDDDEAFYASLGHQKTLESLKLRTTDEWLDIAAPRHITFIDSICSCPELRDLDLMQVQLTYADLVQLGSSLPQLEELSFDGDFLTSDNDILDPLGQMRQLKTLNIYGLTTFTFDGILDFINRLGTDSKQPGASHQGFRFYIMAQNGYAKLSPGEEQLLSDELASGLGGRLDLTYWRDPDEEMSEELSD
ncbi:RNI-like protein [Pleurostoma richardsiae]|uniref:RNI-like protein n=1 Tax=Pleurostoma richardsiae TaxID=41990 RepID=A0AA38RP55_9PEZI|nr:RNI-like protein [Pleurostoma richardsiae]